MMKRVFKLNNKKDCDILRELLANCSEQSDQNDEYEFDGNNEEYVGPSQDFSGLEQPIQFYEQFITDDLTSMIAIETNRYVEQQIAIKRGIDTKSLTKPTQIVLTPAEEILNKGHLIAMDNYYYSPELYDLLCQLKTDATGTVRVNREQLPKRNGGVMHHRQCRIPTLLFFLSYWKRPLNLNKLIEELENEQLPDDVVIFPPEDANGENTDEDSGDKDLVQISNLPGSQLRAEAITNLTRSTTSDSSEDEDDIPGYVCVPRRDMYWKRSPDSTHDLIANAMSRNRFRFIMQNLHCSNNANLDIQDKFSKVRPLIDATNQRFIDLAPQEESMGSSTTIQDKYKQFGVGASIVLQFVDTLENKASNISYDIYFDNFCTTLQLLEELKSRGHEGTGTIRENRLGKDCKIMVSDTLKKKESETVLLPPNPKNHHLNTIPSNSCFHSDTGQLPLSTRRQPQTTRRSPPPRFTVPAIINRFGICDNKNSREEKKAEDELAAFRDVFYITADEQLTKFRERCFFE
ncbi:hypothetical protein ILUMI_24711 [Ignelater luminosus]|uniref:PiggyBac transposable element-derived protein domain-containing protein n=1 Tax=Ignelater luminosus TaxID=2038154 RepID=A0A8K0G0Q4_IGNLU|nr:hypothetical protein ILUMI_24711 [Ignelater luminosus]